jgi:hypothetical protein
MKKMIQVSLIVLTSLGFSRVSFGQAKPTTPPVIEKKTKTSSEKQASILTGQVTSVDAKAGKLTVKVKHNEIHLNTDSDSTKTALERLKVGDTARVFEKEGKVIAASPVKAKSKNKAPK